MICESKVRYLFQQNRKNETTEDNEKKGILHTLARLEDGPGFDCASEAEMRKALQLHHELAANGLVARLDPSTLTLRSSQFESTRLQNRLFIRVQIEVQLLLLPPDAAGGCNSPN